jgi:hypothetical protein
MKNLLLITLLNCLIFLSCRKTATVVNTTIIGKWMLIETLIDPGDGSGEWMPVNPPNYYMKFEPGNSIESDISRGSGNASKYKILTASTLFLIYAESDTVFYSYKITGSFLTLEGGCYERCAMKFKKDHK